MTSRMMFLLVMLLLLLLLLLLSMLASLGLPAITSLYILIR